MNFCILCDSFQGRVTCGHWTNLLNHVIILVKYFYLLSVHSQHSLLSHNGNYIEKLYCRECLLCTIFPTSISTIIASYYPKFVFIFVFTLYCLLPVVQRKQSTVIPWVCSFSPSGRFSNGEELVDAVLAYQAHWLAEKQDDQGTECSWRGGSSCNSEHCTSCSVPYMLCQLK